MTFRFLFAIGVLIGLANPALTDSRPFNLSSKSVIEPAQEVPVAGLPDPTDPTDGSSGLGNAIITLNSDKTRAEIKVTFSNLSGAVTRLHLHCAAAGTNGPIALGLVDLVAIGQDNSEVTTLGANTITAEIRKAQFSDNNCEAVIGQRVTNVRHLFRAIQAGYIYFNLHTAAFPAGELRGQIERLKRTFY